MKSKLLLFVAALALLSFPRIVFGQAPDLGAASSFALFTSVGAFTNLGPSLVTGDIGTNAGPLTGFPPGTLNGAIHIEDAVSLQASTDLSLAYSHLVNLPCGEVMATTLGNGQVVVPNIYCLGAAASLTGDLTLDGQGDPSALFIFQIDGAMETSTYSNVFLINGAAWQNVYWQINGAFTLGDYSAFRGNILANGAIELLEGSSLDGRGLSIAGAIHLHNNIVNSGSPPVASADLAIIKTCNTAPVVAGEQIVYVLNVTNNGPGDAQSVTISDILPLAITNNEFSSDGGVTWNLWTNPYSAGTLTTGGTISLMIRGMVDAGLTGNLVNTGTVSSITPDPDMTNNTSTVTSLIGSSADMQIDKTCLTSLITAGLPIQYAITVQNNGPSAALGVVIMDDIPMEISMPQYALSLTGPWLPWTGSYAVGAVLNGGNMTIYIQGTLITGASGNITNVGNVNSTTPDPDLTNNTSTVIVAVGTLADLAIVKTCNTTLVVAGQQIVYTLNIANYGPGDAQSVTISDILPLSITNSEFSVDGGATWNLWTDPYNVGALAFGNTISLMIRGMVDAGLTGNLMNTGTVSSITPDPDLTNNTSTVTNLVTSRADMQIIKTVLTSPVIAGMPIRYSLAIQNNGPSTAFGVMILDNVPLQILQPQYALSLTGPWLPWTGSYPAGTILPGAGMTIYIQGTLIASATCCITNTAIVSSATPDPDLTNNTSTVIVSVGTLADMAITKTCTTAPLVLGQQIVYTLLVVNNGPGDAQNVTISDAVPSSITNVQYSTNGGTIWLTWNGSYNSGTLAALQSFTFLIRGTLTANPTGIITNTAVVSSTTNDPDLTNNSSTAVTGVNRPPVTFSEQVYTCKNATVGGNVLLNGDYDPDATALTVNTVPVVNTVHGAFTVLSNGNFTYTPSTGYTGSDMAVVSVCDNGIPMPSQCTNDTVFLHVVISVTADAGANQQLCAHYTTFLTGNFPPSGSIGNWSFVSGPNVVTPEPANTPAATVSGLIASVIPYVFHYTISTTFPGGTTCMSEDTMSIINYYYPSLPFAGPDQYLYLSSGTSVSTTMQANLPMFGLGSWVQQSGPSVAVIGFDHDPNTTISNLVAGSYAFLWIIGNGVCDSNQDELFINVYAPSSVNAGPDITICEGSTALISGSQATNYTGLLWATTGSGYFSNSAILHPVYIPGVGDITNGSVKLYLTAYNNAPYQFAVDTMLLTISRQALISAGPGVSTCQGSPIAITGATALYATSLLWTAPGPGVLTGEATLTPTYTPSPGQSGSVMLTLSATSEAPCNGVTSQAMLSINALPAVDAGPDQSIPYGTSTRLSGKVTTGSGPYAFEWQPASLALGYTTPNPETVILTAPVTFRLTVTDLRTGCAATDEMDITFSSHNLPPVAVNDYDTTGVIIPININILRNDYDPDGRIASITICKNPTNGWANMESDSTLTYTPRAGFSGLDSLCYFICDNGVPVLCDTATVYIWVSWDSPVNWLVIYNVITPNADGNNDRWVVDGIEKFPNNTVVIFNRWGDRINSYERYDNNSVVWDGTNLEGQLVSDGTYYYILTIKDGGSRNGWILVRRGSN